MEIIIGKNAGFCYGVKRAVENALIEAKKGKVYCLGEIVHNKNVVNNLKESGIEFINDIQQKNSTTIIRPHGENKIVYKKAKEMGIKLIDLTCPSVLKIHGIVSQYSKEGYYVIITGKKNHPEVLGIKSYVQSKCIIISNIEELYESIEEIGKEKKILLISQTTYNSKSFKDIANFLKKRIKEDKDLVIKNTICLTTENRQKETKELAQKVKAMIIIGDKKSSNTTELYNIALNYCANTQFLLNPEEIDLDKIKGIKKVGIMAGASTPKEDIHKAKEILLKYDEQN